MIRTNHNQLLHRTAAILMVCGLIASVQVALAATDPIEVHVAPTGDDAADGSRAKPVASLGVEHGTWSLAVTLPGRQTKTSVDLPYRHKGFRQLTWFGRMSNANATTTSYIDGVSLSVKQRTEFERETRKERP